jgi:excisionase family DNA binding protein
VTELVSVAETAERLSLSPRYIRKLIADGELVCVRIGDRVLIRPLDIADFIERRIDDRRQMKAVA